MQAISFTVGGGSSSVENNILEIKDKVTELHKIGGLDVDHPATTTTTSVTVDDIRIDISGNGQTTTTFTRSV